MVFFCIISGIFDRYLGICLLSLLFSIHVFGFCVYACVTAPHTQRYSQSVKTQNEMCGGKTILQLPATDWHWCPSILTCKCMDTVWSFRKREGGAQMAVRCKPEMFTVFECRCLLKDLLKIDIVARTLMKSNEQCWTDQRKRIFHRTILFLATLY